MIAPGKHGMSTDSHPVAMSIAISTRLKLIISLR